MSRALLAELPVRGGGLLVSRALLVDRDRARLRVELALFLSSREDHGLTQKRARVRLKSAIKVEAHLGCPSMSEMCSLKKMVGRLVTACLSVTFREIYDVLRVTW